MENAANAGGSRPLNDCSPERVNQQRPQSAIFSSLRSDHNRESSVHDKISQFNTLALHGKQVERKAADAALTRAMVGREEAESEMRRYRDEVRALRKHAEEAKERERKVGERMEEIMEKYIRLKEMHQHTQSVWEKEIRRQRKEYFKANSSGVRYAEELKLAKESLRAAESGLVKEKARSRAREQEAFAARYQIVGVQEQLEKALEKIKLVEQERDAFKTLAKNEEVARIAAEGCIPLPPAETDDDEFASPKKVRVSLPVADVVSSAASEEEIEELTRQVEWERQRADRAQEHVEFLMAECELRCCPCAKARQRNSLLSPQRVRPQTVEVVDAGDLAILSEKAIPPPKEDTLTSSRQEPLSVQEPAQEPVQEPVPEPKRKEKRRSTIFCAQEGIFRTVSQEEAEALERVAEDEQPPTESPESPADYPTDESNMYARTPSVDPPSFALLAHERMSLLSLLNAPHTQRESDLGNLPVIPTMAATITDEDRLRHSCPQDEGSTTPRAQSPDIARPHTTASFYAVTTTTTTVPIRDKAAKKGPGFGSSFHRGQGTYRAGEASTFDANNPAMTPTMTREQALAQIRERRGRARSAAQGAATPRRQMFEGVERRDASAPTGRMAKART
ncbi:uncharacterized protein DNG_05983 [Cephalotrichum gorgonifer]|uniref:Uncharacterized protein n=1 Tax=Cephalotrichum gorgonifer TaxID=2041049 RepID=A0AAE8SW08_9PEZI|nr:uncharacterized protein DNG_05983 [Cephalotrichum gorgonifer]